MGYRPPRRLCEGILAALLALGMSLSAVSAGILPTQMQISMGADGARADCCADCADPEDAMSACLLACLAGTQAVLPGEVVASARCSGEIGARVRPAVSGRTVHPDPHPPRPFVLD